MSVSPASASAVVGSLTSPVSVAIASQNGFSAPVNITLGSLPQGVEASPSSPFSITPGASQHVTVSVMASAAAGTFPLTVLATSGLISHSAQFILTVEPIVTVSASQNGSLLYLESSAPTGTARVGLETLWGGSIVEVSLNGTNYVNLYDTGREVQVAEYDGNATYDSCAGCTGNFGWDPVQGGDRYAVGSPVLAQAVTPNSLYIKTQPYQWYPDDKGGGPGQPVLGDIYAEATITAVRDHAFTFRVHYKITHFGTDQHANAQQEFPAAYVNLGFNRFAVYRGFAPWTNDAVSFPNIPILPNFSPLIYAPEQWAAYVDSRDGGLTVYIPGTAPYFGGFSVPGLSGPSGFGTNYFAPFTTFSFGPGSVLEGDVYLIAGDYKHARQVIYDLHTNSPANDSFSPFGSVDTPAPNSQLTGFANVSGWAVDNVAVSTVAVYVDGFLAGPATYGTSRPDVAQAFPGAPSDCGYTFSLDTRPYANGPHSLEIKAFDTAGNLAFFPPVPITILN